MNIEKAIEINEDIKELESGKTITKSSPVVLA